MPRPQAIPLARPVRHFTYEGDGEKMLGVRITTSWRTWEIVSRNPVEARQWVELLSVRARRNTVGRQEHLGAEAAPDEGTSKGWNLSALGSKLPWSRSTKSAEADAAEKGESGEKAEKGGDAAADKGEAKADLTAVRGGLGRDALLPKSARL